MSVRIGRSSRAVPTGTHALVAHPIQRRLVAVDLATGAEHALSWLDAAGPTYVAIQPSP